MSDPARYVFFLPQTGPVFPRAVDEAIPAEAGGHIGRFSGKTHDQLRAQYGAELDVMELDAFTHMHEEALRTEPTQIPEDEYQRALECLPPLDWGHALGVESFKMSEFYSGQITTIYARCGHTFWRFHDRASMTRDAIAHRIGAAKRAAA